MYSKYIIKSNGYNNSVCMSLVDSSASLVYKLKSVKFKKIMVINQSIIKWNIFFTCCVEIEGNIQS